MDFLKFLEVEEETEIFKICKHIPVSDTVSLSIQASKFHYCTPRENLPLDKYTHYEMAIIKDGFVTDNILGTLGDIPYREELEEYDCGGVFAYVPKELINKIFLWSVIKEEINL